MTSIIIGHILTKDTVLIWNSQDAIKLRRECRIVGSFIGGLPTHPRQTTHYGLPLKLLPEETTLLLEKGILKIQIYKPQEEDGDDLNSPCLKKEKREEKEESEQLQVVNESSEKDSTNTVCIHTADQISVNIDSTTNTDLDFQWTWPTTDQEKLRYRVFSDLWHRKYYITPGLKYGGDYLVYSDDPAIVHSHFIAKIITWDETITPLSLVQDGRLGGKVKKRTLLCTINSRTNTVQYITVSWSGIV